MQHRLKVRQKCILFEMMHAQVCHPSDSSEYSPTAAVYELPSVMMDDSDLAQAAQKLEEWLILDCKQQSKA